MRALRSALLLIELIARCDYLLYASSSAAEVRLRPLSSYLIPRRASQAVIYRHFALHNRSLNLDFGGDVRIPWAQLDGVDDYSSTISSHCRVRGSIFNIGQCATSLESERENKWRAVTITLNFVSVAATEASSETLLEPKARQGTNPAAISIKTNFSRTMDEAINAAVDATSGHVRVDVETMITSPIVAAEVVDGWLTPRLEWSVLNESEYHVVLHRPSGYRQVHRLLRAIQGVQYTSSKVVS